ncbi:phage tail tube protein [Peptostreptococcus equinus]|uniref:Phage tail tube protein n=1 Tax=Peptostreptococcus equinus TaxID=3003601 RepID=A0ABY7JQA1_9FIRM|nr:phage tail tube protein [Peptostreptococcus sp. CBA3647]WAW15290.1 phage tail tube protein [Peptostreptococcus sp. CBA3647]
MEKGQVYEILGTEGISGTFGEVWLDGEYVAEIEGCQLKVDFEKQTVARPRRMMKAHKTVGAEGKGSVTMTKVKSRMINLIGQRMQDQKTLAFELISKLDDPDSIGAERIKAKDVQFDDLTLADWKNGEVGKIEAPFTFDGFDLIDVIK